MQATISLLPRILRATLWANEVLKPISMNGDVVAVRVHLKKCPCPSEVAAVDVPIQGIVINLEHSLLFQQSNSDSDLERLIDYDPKLPAFQLIGLVELFHIVEVHLSQHSVHHLLIFCADHARFL